MAAHGPAKIACHVKYYQLLMDLIGDKERSDILFLTSTGEKVTHIAHELGEAFGKKLMCTPTMNRKRIATSIGARKPRRVQPTTCLTPLSSVYQHLGDKDESVNKYVLHRYAHALMHSYKRLNKVAMDQSGWSGEEEEEDETPPPAKRKNRMCYTKEEEVILGEYFDVATLTKKPKIPHCKEFLRGEKSEWLGVAWVSG